MERTRIRKGIISIFEATCLFGVYVVILAGAALVLAAFQGGGNPVLAILVAVAGFIASCLVFGGALTLLDIAASLEKLVALASAEKAPSSPPDGSKSAVD